MGEVLPKIAMGGLFGGLGGALSDDPQELTSMINQQGSTGLPDGFPQRYTVDPGDLLARGLSRNELVFNALAQHAAQPVTLGPAANYQTPAYIYGGSLPGPMGISIQDPGFSPLPGIDILGTGLFDPTGGNGLGEELGPDGPPPEGPGSPGHPPYSEPGEPPQAGEEPPWWEDPSQPIDPWKPVDPMPDPPEGNPARSQTPSLLKPKTPNLGLPVSEPEMNKFLDAVNLLQLPQGRPPFVRGGLN